LTDHALGRRLGAAHQGCPLVVLAVLSLNETVRRSINFVVWQLLLLGLALVRVVLCCKIVCLVRFPVDTLNLRRR
jgi:hypothetical protein